MLVTSAPSYDEALLRIVVLSYYTSIRPQLKVYSLWTALNHSYPHNYSQSPYSGSASLIPISLVPKVLFNSLQPIKFWFSSSPVAFLIFHDHLSSPHARTNSIVPIYLFYHFPFHSCSSTHMFVYNFYKSFKSSLAIARFSFPTGQLPETYGDGPNPTQLVSSTSSPTH